MRRDWYPSVVLTDWNLRTIVTSVPAEISFAGGVAITTVLAGVDSNLRWMWIGFALFSVLFLTICQSLRRLQPREYELINTQLANRAQKIASALVGIVGNRNRIERKKSFTRLLAILVTDASIVGSTPEMNRAIYYKIEKDSRGIRLIKEEQSGRADKPAPNYHYHYGGGEWSRFVIKYLQNPNAPTMHFDDVNDRPHGLPADSFRTFRSMAWAPVHCRNTTVGVLTVDSPRPRAFKPADASILGSIATAIGTGISCILCDVDDQCYCRRQFNGNSQNLS